MNCTCCETALPLKARFCPWCGAKVKTWEELLSDDATLPDRPPRDTADDRSGPARDDGELRARLLQGYLRLSMSKELSDWLAELGLPSGGTLQEQLARLRRQAGSLVLPAESFPRQTLYYLAGYDDTTLAEICQELGLDSDGSRDVLVARIYHAVGLREGWLQPLAEDARRVITETFLPFLKTDDRARASSLEHPGAWSDMLGADQGSLPSTRAYGSAVIAVLVPGFFQEGQVALLEHELRARIAGRRGSNR